MTTRGEGAEARQAAQLAEQDLAGERWHRRGRAARLRTKPARGWRL